MTRHRAPAVAGLIALGMGLFSGLDTGQRQQWASLARALTLSPADFEVAEAAPDHHHSAILRTY